MSEFNEKWAIEEAVNAAINSNCKSKRGVIIWDRKTGQFVTGWNEPPKPFICDNSDKCREECSKVAVHAEQAALMELLLFKNLSVWDCEMLHVKVVDKKAVVSEKPSCWQCSKLILKSGLKSMWLYQKEGFIEYTPYDFHRLTLENCNLTGIE